MTTDTDDSHPPATADSRPPVVAFLGNPNTGKTTLFNALTGLRQRVGNYPGVTVERKIGRLQLKGGGEAELLDLPGLYSLAARSPDELIAVDVLMGLHPGERPIDAIVCVVDASNLQRSLFLASQVMDLGLPTVVALNMGDVAISRGIVIDPVSLQKALGVPVVPTRANRGEGLEDLKDVISIVLGRPENALPTSELLPQFPEEVGLQVDSIVKMKGHSPGDGLVDVARLEATRALLDMGGLFESRLVERIGDGISGRLDTARGQLSASLDLSLSGLAGLESRIRHDWAKGLIRACVRRPNELVSTTSDRIDRWLTHRVFGSVLFLAVMMVVFQALYAWADPLMGWIEALFTAIGGTVHRWMPEGALRSLVVDGVIGGAGSVLVFLPQIGILFLFIALLEDCGYMARAAFLMDRILARFGLSGKSFIPLMSSFACAVPGIMSARTIDNRRTRIVTILVAPLMSCSARLPVYVIMISAFIPEQQVFGAWIGIQGLTLLGMYCVGVFTALPVAWLANRVFSNGQSAPFILELPSYKLPDARTVGLRVYQSCASFITRAGSIILAAAIVLWALAYYPRADVVSVSRGDLQGRTSTGLIATGLTSKEQASRQLAESFIGKAGRFIEPAVKPLGWDWRIGVAAISSFPAREVVISTLGTLFSLGDVDETSEDLRDALKRARWPDGRPLFTVATALSVMVFFALCAQCLATLAVIRRETGSWIWPSITFGYMTILAYVCAFVVYQTATALGAGGGA